MTKYNILMTAILLKLIINIVNAIEICDGDSNKVYLYGKVANRYSFSKEEKGDQTYVSLGYKGKTQINDQLIGYGQLVYNFTSNKILLANSCLKIGNYNSLNYGRDYGIIYDALSYTDKLPGFGIDTVYSDNFFSGIVSGVLTYHNTNFFGLVNGLNFNIQYLVKNERTTSYQPEINNFNDIRRSNGNGWGTSLNYTFNNFTIISAYGTANRTNAQKDSRLLGHGRKTEQWAASLKYNINKIYLAANYSKNYNATPIIGGFANKTQNIIFIAQYQFDFELRPSIAYIQSRAKNIENIGNENLAKYIEIGATYFFNKSMSTYIDYKINKISNANKFNINSSNMLVLGIVYNF